MTDISKLQKGLRSIQEIDADTISKSIEGLPSLTEALGASDIDKAAREYIAMLDRDLCLTWVKREIASKAFIAGAQSRQPEIDELREALKEATRWRDYKTEPPTEGEEVIAYNPAWIDEDFNPNGTRIGFRCDLHDSVSDFTSAYWWNHQDCYMTISHVECDGRPEYSDFIKNNIEPTHWRPIDTSKASQLLKKYGKK